MGNQIDEILEERGKIHGNAASQFALAQALKGHINTAWMGRTPPGPMVQEGMDMILTKISRIGVGDPLEEDHWRDIAGYATLVANDIAKNKSVRVVGSGGSGGKY